MKIQMYLHGDQEDNYYTGKKLGLTGNALENFRYALHMVEFDIEVNEKTGNITIVKVNGKNLEQ